MPGNSRRTFPALMAVLFGFVFVLLALLGAASLFGSAAGRSLRDPSLVRAALIALVAAAAIFGVSLRLALRDRDGEEGD